jgi:hypothetical protein
MNYNSFVPGGKQKKIDMEEKENSVFTVSDWFFREITWSVLLELFTNLLLRDRKTAMHSLPFKCLVFYFYYKYLLS